VAEILKAPIAHTSRGKDSLEYDNPYNVGMPRTRSPATFKGSLTAGESSKMCFQWFGKLPNALSSTCPVARAVAKAMGLWGRTVAKVDELEAAIGEWLGTSLMLTETSVSRPNATRR
jgi:thiamine pyrophosphate-dependent acetolactate synthase large subunit-like protein